jgi:predicted nucleotidyltransferase
VAEKNKTIKDGKVNKIKPELEIYRSAYRLAKEMQKIRSKMPRSVKHDLGQQAFSSCLNVLREIAKARRNSDEKKIQALLNIEIEAELMWTWLRLLWEFNAIKESEHLLLSEILDDVTTQAKAWRKWAMMN